MITSVQISKAAAFGKLHGGPGILVLPNAWDAASARVFETLGFPALATTSAGIANARGYPDGERIPGAEMIAAISRIVRAVSVPVTADIEAGYGSTLDGVVETIKQVIAAGAVGINLEDADPSVEASLFDIPTQVRKIRAVRAASDAVGVPLVINARTDIYLSSAGDPGTRLRRTVDRLNAYREAGADCLFAPGVRDAETISALARDVRGPLNILAGQGTPVVLELEKMGVRRVSIGSGPARAAMTLVRRIGEELLSQGTYSSFTEGTITYAEANKLFER